MAPPFRDGFDAGVIPRGFIIGAIAEVNGHPLRGVLGGGAYWSIGGGVSKSCATQDHGLRRRFSTAG